MQASITNSKMPLYNYQRWLGLRFGIYSYRVLCKIEIGKDLLSMRVYLGLIELSFFTMFTEESNIFVIVSFQWLRWFHMIGISTGQCTNKIFFSSLFSMKWSNYLVPVVWFPKCHYWMKKCCWVNWLNSLLTYKYSHLVPLTGSMLFTQWLETWLDLHELNNEVFCI